MVFDAPGLKENFDKRYEKMKEVFNNTNNPYIHLVPHQVCKGKENLEDELKKVEEKGGEGLMLRDPKSKYINKR